MKSINGSRIILQTERLVLREFTLDDVAFVVRLLNQPSFLRYIGDRGVRTLEDAQVYIEQGPLKSYVEHGFGLYVVALESDAQPVGMCGIMRKPWLDAPDIAYAFLPEHEGNGYASEAAGAILDHARRALGLDVIVGVVTPENAGSIRVLQKLGFTHESRIVDPRNEHELEFFAHRL